MRRFTVLQPGGLVKANDVENTVLRLWTTTRLPITLAALQLATNAPRAKLQKQLDALVVNGVLDMDSDDVGTALWSVVGVPRARTGPTTIAEWETLQRLSAEVARDRPSPSSSALAGVGGGREHKSVVLSAALSLFTGGFGLLYAAPLSVAGAAIVAQMLLVGILPHSVAVWLLGLVLPFSGIAGGAYAWAHNKHGRRTALSAAFGLGRVKELPARRT